MDCWEDDEGRAQWSARVVMRLGLVLDERELAGRTSIDESGPVMLSWRIDRSVPAVDGRASGSTALVLHRPRLDKRATASNLVAFATEA
jgi:hypothetical protein